MKQDIELQEASSRNMRELLERVGSITKSIALALENEHKIAWTHVGSLASINQALKDVESHIRALQALGE